MKKSSVAEKKILMFAGVIVISVIGLAFAVNKVISLESNREGQAKVMANMIAVSVNSMSTMDAGYVQKSFDVKEPFTVTVYDKKGVMYVKVIYDSEKNKFYEVPLLVKIDPVAPVSLDRVSVTKGKDGKVYVKGELIAGRDVAISGDLGCVQPTLDEIKQYIKEASQRSTVDEARIKAVMRVESCSCHCGSANNFCTCKNGYILQSSQGALGLMQLKVSTGANVRVDAYDSRQNVIGGALYMKNLYEQFNSWNLAYAAYNAGPGRLTGVPGKYPNCMAECGLTSGSTPQDIQNCKCLPKDTQDYPLLVTEYYSSCFAPEASCNMDRCKLC